jgi:serine/threonine protein kinase
MTPEDDDKPKFNVTVIDDNAFELPNRYEVSHILGNGGYGIVASGYDNVTKQKVAVKKLPNVFEKNKE